MLRAVIFDLDGVLIDSEPLMRFAFEQCYQQVVGDTEPPIEAYLEHMGESFPRIMQQLGLPLSLWQPYRDLCRRHLDKIKLFPAAKPLLERLRSSNLKLALLTGKDRQRTVQLLEYFELDRFFDLVLASDQLRNPKPDPEGMLRVLDHLACQADQAIMIGDSVSDIVCAQRAGVGAIAVSWGIKPERVQTLCRPDYIVHSWQALTHLLLQPDCREHAGALVPAEE